jgi:hypothetical protein
MTSGLILTYQTVLGYNHGFVFIFSTILSVAVVLRAVGTYSGARWFALPKAYSTIFFVVNHVVAVTCLYEFLKLNVKKIFLLVTGSKMS